jgi:hypothetical protein
MTMVMRVAKAASQYTCPSASLPSTPHTPDSTSMAEEALADALSEPIAFNVSDNYAIHEIVGEGAYGVVV